MRKKRKQLDFVVAAIQHRRTTVRIAVLGVVHQAPPTAKGFHFITLEDEAGLIDVIVNPQIYARYRPLWRSESLLIVNDTVQQQGGVVNLPARRAAAMPNRF